MGCNEAVPFRYKDEAFSRAVVVVGTVLTAFGSCGLTAQLLSPGTLLGALNYFIVGSILMISHSKKLQHDLYKALPGVVRDFAFEKSLLELFRNKSRYIQISAFLCACLTLPSDKLDRLQNDLPSTFDHCKRKGILNALNSKALKNNGPIETTKFDQINSTVHNIRNQKSSADCFTSCVAMEIIGSFIGNSAVSGLVRVSDHAQKLLSESWIPFIGMLGASSACYWILLGADNAGYAQFGKKIISGMEFFLSSSMARYSHALRKLSSEGFEKVMLDLIGPALPSAITALSVVGGATTVGLGLGMSTVGYKPVDDVCLVEQCSQMKDTLDRSKSKGFLYSKPLNRDFIYKHNEKSHTCYLDISHGKQRNTSNPGCRERCMSALLLAVYLSKLPTRIVEVSIALLVPKCLYYHENRRQKLQQHPYQAYLRINEQMENAKSWEISQALIFALSLRLCCPYQNLSWLIPVLHFQIIQYLRQAASLCVHK